MSKRKILVTSALPYANAGLHLGHMLEQIQTDVWVRFQKMRGHECYYVCADDTHGTPIMLKAQAEGITPEQLIAGIEAEHTATYRDFLIDHSWFHSTHSEENKRCTEKIFKALDAAGYITRRTIRQAYDESAGMFLPDRYVKGICPRCDAADQYGDSCEVCGATYSPADLIAIAAHLWVVPKQAQDRQQQVVASLSEAGVARAGANEKPRIDPRQGL